MSNMDRKVLSISLNPSQQQEISCVMDHLGVDQISTAYKMLVKRYIRDNGLNPDDIKYVKKAEEIREIRRNYR